MPDDPINTDGRKANAAQPLNAAKDNAGAERYPSVRQDDGVESSNETRSFDPPRNPNPPQGAGDGPIPPSANEDRPGAGADPAKGKR
jgi:hypothetical protein